MLHNFSSSLTALASFPRILIFDSGIGGIGTFSALKEMEKNYDIHYLADTGFFPYGEKTDEELKERILSIISKAVKALSPDMVIIACNTASTLALPILRENFQNLFILGCVPPIRWAASLSKTRCLGLLSTSATARRSYVDYLQKEFAPDCRIYRHGSSTLAKEAEKIFRDELPSIEIILKEIESLFLSSSKNERKIDCVALGCTHYTFLLPWLEKYSPQNVKWLDPQPAVAKHADNLLKNYFSTKEMPLLNQQSSFFYTGEEIIKSSSLFRRLHDLGFKNIQQLS
ncbi:glutamate racemase [Acetobacteraceae bacterium]|nr:glutamate racemase [Acetobacteraceae bacterium]